MYCTLELWNQLWNGVCNTKNGVIFVIYSWHIRHFITDFITLGYSTLVQQIYWLWKIPLVYMLQSTVLLECVQLKRRFITIKGVESSRQLEFTWMCSVEKPIYNDQILFQLHRSKQDSSEISEQWHTAVLMWPSYFIYQHKYQQSSTNIQDYGVFWYG